MSSLEAPDFAEPLEAWRAWRVVRGEDGLRLASVVKTTVWPWGEPLRAACLRPAPFRLFGRRRPPQVSPDPRCDCGIYAARLEDAGSYLQDALASGSVGRVIGRVSLWGTVVECERGFRASHAYPLELYVPRDSARRRGCSAEGIAAALGRYGVPVQLLDVSCAEAVPALERAV